MNDFKDAYQTAVQNLDVLGMKEFNLDASLCMDEGKHQKRRTKQVHRAAATAFSAICVVFMFSFGTAETVEYIGNVTKENQRGFKAGAADAMSENNREMNQTYIVEEEIAGYTDLSKDTKNGTARMEPETMAVDGLLSAMKESTAEPESAEAESMAESAAAMDESAAEPGSEMYKETEAPGTASGREGNPRSVSGNAAVTKAGQPSVSSNTGRQNQGR